MNDNAINGLQTRKIGLKVKIVRRGEHREEGQTEDRTKDQSHADECLSGNKQFRAICNKVYSRPHMLNQPSV